MKKILTKLIRLFSDEQVDTEFLRRFKEDFNFESLSEEESNLVFQDLSKIDNVDDFLLSTLKNDRLRYFGAPKESQDMIKGAFMRIVWLLKEIRNKRNLKEKVANAKYSNPRQG